MGKLKGAFIFVLHFALPITSKIWVGGMQARFAIPIPPSEIIRVSLRTVQSPHKRTSTQVSAVEWVIVPFLEQDVTIAI